MDVHIYNRLGYLKTVIDKNETLRLIDSISNINPIDNLTEKYLYNKLSISL